MFKELSPFLRQRAVLLTVTHLEEDQIRVNIVPQKLKDGENNALMTPLTVTGTAEDLDRDLPSSIVDFVSSHLQLKNTLNRAKEEMDAAAKTAQAEARSKAKTPAKKELPKAGVTPPAEPSKPAPAPQPEPPKTASLFGDPAPQTPAAASVSDADEEDEILAEAAEDQQADESEDEDEDLDEAA
jgi:PRTRC genetic system protein E